MDSLLPVILKPMGSFCCNCCRERKRDGHDQNTEPEKKRKGKEKASQNQKREKNRRHLISLLRKSLPSEFGPLRPKLQDSANQALALI